ncbi:hypothetical protein ABBQ38_004020 [Trebouxia sp. C0009 RCD-2024]
MDFLTFLAIYIGDLRDTQPWQKSHNQAFAANNCIVDRGTSAVHICVSFWGFFGISWWLLHRVCGGSAALSLGNASKYCCEKRNPILQLFYLTLLAVSYYLYCRDVFSLLPLPYAPSWHQWTGAGVLGVCLLIFGVTSAADPGVVTADNEEFHQSLYPYDDVTNAQQDCDTCHISKPARSKHCRICNVCVARFDHHCGWVNNCVGMYNIRFFLGFLLINLVLCLYAVTLLCIVLSGILHKHNLWYERTPWHSRGSGSLVRRPANRLLQWLLVYYPVPTMLLVFLSLGTLMIGCFFAYHCSLIARGMTSYETFKWQDYKDHCMEMAKESRRRQIFSISASLPGTGPWLHGCCLPPHCPRQGPGQCLSRQRH